MEYIQQKDLTNGEEGRRGEKHKSKYHFSYSRANRPMTTYHFLIPYNYGQTLCMSIDGACVSSSLLSFYPLHCTVTISDMILTMLRSSE
jgi:hypothetical protein